MADNIEILARQQLDRRLDQIREVVPVLRPPRGGWLLSLRNALGMSQEVLAKRMGVSQQAIGQLEQREAGGSVTIRALQQAAEKLGGEVVYAIVPAKPIQETLEARALQVASRMTGAVRHTMRLEDQEPSSDLHQRTEELARELLSLPEQLWLAPDGE